MKNSFDTEEIEKADNSDTEEQDEVNLTKSSSETTYIYTDIRYKPSSSILYRGENYFVPEFEEKARYCFDNISIATETHGTGPDAKNAPLTCIPDIALENAIIQLSNVSPNIEPFYYDKPLIIHVYKLEEAAPIKSFQIIPNEDISIDTEIILDIPFENNEKYFGDYFILFANAIRDTDIYEEYFEWSDAFLVYPFSIYPYGRWLNSPNIKKATAELIDFNKLNIELEINFQDKEKPRELCIEIYNEGLIFLDEYRYVLKEINKNKNNLLLNLYPQFPLVPGNFIALVLQNREVFARLDFTITQMGKNQKCKITKLNDSSWEFCMSKHLSWEHHKDWLPISQLGGAKDIKKKFIHHFARFYHNKQRQIYSFPEISFPEHYIVITPENNEERENILKKIPRLISRCYDIQHYDAELLVDSQNINPFELIDKILSDRDRKTIVIHNLDAFNGNNGQAIAHRLEKAMKDQQIYWSLIITGNKDETERFIEAYPGIASLIGDEQRMQMEQLDLQEILYILFQKLEEMEFCVYDDTVKHITQIIQKAWKEESIRHWSTKEIMEFIQKDIITNIQQRILQAPYILPSKLRDVHLSDIKSTMLKCPKQEDTFEASIERLKNMVGLEHIKQQMISNFMLMKFYQMRKQANLPAENEESHHMIFTGNPGTGKTTVAKMIGKIYHSLGMLSKGNVIVAERSQLVGRYLGETETKMQSILANARGNVLFIDEAYTLCDNTNGDRKDFGFRVIESLLTTLSRKKTDMLVILAGYEKEMISMLETNPGLKGRFPHKFNFPDYTSSELLQIGINFLNDKKYILTADAKSELNNIIIKTLSEKDRFFSNGRWMETFILNELIPAMAERIINTSNSKKSISELQTIKQCDVKVAFKKSKEKARTTQGKHGNIGFHSKE